MARHRPAILILSQGNLAPDLVRAAETIAGRASGFQALSLDWESSLEAGLEKARRALSSAQTEHGLLILTDLHGSTPCNVAMALAAETGAEVLAGVNLPMVLRLACGDPEGRSPAELADWLMEKGRRSICHPETGNGG